MKPNYQRKATAPANLALYPFYFEWFFQNVSIGHGGLIATINAYYAVRTGAAYSTR